MKTITFLAITAAAAVLIAMTGGAKNTNVPTKQQQIARGQYLVSIAVCRAVSDRAAVAGVVFGPAGESHE